MHGQGGILAASSISMTRYYIPLADWQCKQDYTENKNRQVSNAQRLV